MKKILIVDDEKNMRNVLAMLLENDGYKVVKASSGAEALGYIEELTDIDLIISDLRMPDKDGMEILHFCRSHQISIPFVLITAYGTIDLAVQAMKRGAADFITKPFNKNLFRHVVNRLLTERAGAEDRDTPKKASDHYTIIYRSQAMENLMSKVRKIAHAHVPVLLLGESGTGKELIARAIHRYSRSLPFISISCPALPGTLIESELFGYAKGAFTGANKHYIGKLKDADGGVLMLDEIGDLPLELQPKLLRFLEEKTYQPIGSNTTITVNTRLITATNRNLLEMVKAGEFREDLFYRINTVSLIIPPLRERREDILPLAEHYAEIFSREMGKKKTTLSSMVKEIFLRHNWPGNVRELKNVIERGVVLAGTHEITLQDIPVEMSHYLMHHELKNTPIPNESFISQLAESEVKLIRNALDKHNCNISAAARELGITRNTLRYKIQKYRINFSV